MTDKQYRTIMRNLTFSIVMLGAAILLTIVRIVLMVLDKWPLF